MDLSKEDRAAGAQVYESTQATSRDFALIAEVLRKYPADDIHQWLALGAACPYFDPVSTRRQRAAWIAEIDRQRAELAAAGERRKGVAA